MAIVPGSADYRTFPSLQKVLSVLFWRLHDKKGVASAPFFKPQLPQVRSVDPGVGLPGNLLETHTLRPKPGVTEPELAF